MNDVNLQKDLKYYINLYKHKKTIVIIIACLVFSTAVVIAYLMPPIYESKATILIEEQQIPPDFVRTTVTGFAEQRIQSLTQQILSRSKLMDIIKQYDLYPEMRDKYTTEEIIEKMREDISISTISAEVSDQARGRRRANTSGITIAFVISYQGKVPGTVQKVTNTLASSYLEQNLKDRQEKAETTTKFLEAELKELNERIEKIGQKISDFKQKHQYSLPELRDHNIAQAERLENEAKQLEAQIRAAQDRKDFLQNQLATLNPDLPLAQDRTNPWALDPKARLYALQVELAGLQATKSPDHPDVRKIKQEIAGLEKLLGTGGSAAAVRRQKITQLKGELAAKQEKLGPENPEIKALQRQIAQLEKEAEKDQGQPITPVKPLVDANNPTYIATLSQMNAADNELAMLKKQLAEVRAKAKMYRDRLELTPLIEQEYAALLRDYQNAHTKHMEVMNKLLESRIAEGMEESQKAEKFTLIEPANLPEKPIRPNRLLISIIGLIFGLALGIAWVGVQDYLDHSIKDSNEVNWLTDTPVLGSISIISSPNELRKLKMRKYWIALSGGVSLVLLLLAIHLFYMDLWVLVAKLQRLAGKVI